MINKHECWHRWHADKNNDVLKCQKKGGEKETNMEKILSNFVCDEFIIPLNE